MAFFFLIAHVCTWMHVHMSVGAHIGGACGSQRVTSGVFLDGSPHYMKEHRLLLELRAHQYSEAN